MSAKDVDNQLVRVNDREQLIYLLTEAAEIEHGLMCSYLYASWSLKQSTEEGLTEVQLAAVDRWRSVIQGVAMEEMLHLALVSNLLMSVGSPPHFSRPNFPIPAGYHPSSMVARLTPFTRQTAHHFVYLERPEGVYLPQVPGFESAQYERREPTQRLTPSAEDFDTVSHLYRGIEEGFRMLAKGLGERALFVGDPRCQLDATVLELDGLNGVYDLDGALKAISTIIEQGEGGRKDAEKSHYMQFCAIRDEYEEFIKHEPNFRPYRQLLSDPVMFAPISKRSAVQVNGKPASQVLDIANAAYGLMLRLLASGFSLNTGPGANVSDKRIEIESAIAVMGVVKSLGILLTTLPANQTLVGAGMNFHLPRSTLALPERHSGKAVLAERAREIGCALQGLEPTVTALGSGLAARMSAVAKDLTDA